MQTIKIQCPAKINLNLKITGNLEGGFHSIKSIMQTINLYDYLTITAENNAENEIVLSGNSNEIPYDETNLVYKAAKLYLDSTKIKNKKITIYVEKNIPVSAGLAGGSTDAAGVLYGLDKIFSASLSIEKTKDCNIDFLCAKLGSDLNVCLHGGRILAEGRGEIITPLEFEEFNTSLIKPINLGISAKEAYTKFSQKKTTNTNYENDLEFAVIDDYPQLQYIKKNYPKAVMTGSGSTYFMINDNFEQHDGYWVKNNLNAVNFGVKEI